MGEGLGERKRGSTGSNIKVLCALVFALDPCLARFPNVARVNIRPQAVRAPWLGGDDLPQLGPPRRGVVDDSTEAETRNRHAVPAAVVHRELLEQLFGGAVDRGRLQRGLLRAGQAGVLCNVAIDLDRARPGNAFHPAVLRSVEDVKTRRHEAVPCLGVRELPVAWEAAEVDDAHCTGEHIIDGGRVCEINLLVGFPATRSNTAVLDVKLTHLERGGRYCYSALSFTVSFIWIPCHHAKHVDSQSEVSAIDNSLQSRGLQSTS